jgi:hypothetical protein
MRLVKNVLFLLSFLLPWCVRRRVLVCALGYAIDPTARIGLSWIRPRRLVMGRQARIGHLTVCKSIDLLEMGESSIIGNGNWITGWPRDGGAHYAHEPERSPRLTLGAHSAITCRHIVDCTDAITIGPFATVAGYRCQLLTHSIDLAKGLQASKPIVIQAYCFVGTNAVILGGSVLPDHSVLGAQALLNEAYQEPYVLYAGVPAVPRRKLSADLGYFTRQTGPVT